MRGRRWTLGLALLAFTAPVAAQDAEPAIELWRLDCGTIELSDAQSFSDAHLYDGQPRTLTNSCYLVRNGDRYLLWDTGLPAALIGSPVTSGVYTVSLERGIAEQLADIGLDPAGITFVGLSHYHFDHVGQAAAFADSILLIHERDLEAVTDGVNEDATAGLAPWLGDSEVTSFAKDHDVFGDGSVTILATPGHTPGHSSLLVRLPESGDVLLSGDLYHFEEQIENRGVPQFNTDRADTLASMERFNAMAAALDATVIIQHDPRYIDRLPAFPRSAR